MKITQIQTFLVREAHRNLVFVKVLTDEGLHGIGEAYSCGPDDATAQVVHHFREPNSMRVAGGHGSSS